MPTITNNLFPPVLPDSQPAFIRTKNFKIYFSLSEYNTLNDIKNVQISIKNQKTNRSALNLTKYPSEIKIVNKNNIILDNSIKDDYKYYIEITISSTASNSDIVNSYLELDQYYIVQMRFTSVAATDPPELGGIDTWLFNQRQYFSEWSTITLIKGIEQPYVSLINLSENENPQLSYQLTKVLGKLYYRISGDLQKTIIRGTVSNGVPTTTGSTRIRTDFINISNYTRINLRIQPEYQFCVHFFNSEKTWLGNDEMIDWTSTNSFFDVKDTYYYMIVIIRKSNNGSISLAEGENLSLSFSQVVYGFTSEYLKSYNIKFYKTDSPNKIIYKTKDIYTNQYNSNEINCEIPYEFDRQVNYTLSFDYITNNGYKPSQPLTYEFHIAAKDIVTFNSVISAIPEKDRGRMKIIIDFDFRDVINSENNLIIKRTSSRSNFKIWETLITIPHDENSIKNIWYDTAIESGVWYKYRIQQDTNSVTSRLTDIQKPVMCVFEDMYLSNGENQIKLQFNPTIGDFKYNVMESQQNTLGSQYPYVRRNGNNFFRSFSIGGLISAFMDDIDWYNSYYSDNKFKIENKRNPFTTPVDIYGNSKNLYEEYNKELNIDQYQDYIYEREFRQKIYDFLYKNDIKLFRSLTEGNMLIKLQNIGFQPTNELGRRLYSFTATAIEIDSFSVENFKKYNIINTLYYVYKQGEILNQEFESNESIIDFILNLSDFDSYNRESFKIYGLNIELNQVSNAVVYIKTLNDFQDIRYETQQGLLNLSLNEDQFIEECYFSGIHLNSEQYTLTDEYYNTLNQIDDPINNGVYYIYYMSTDDYIINNYVDYNDRERILTVEQTSTIENIDQNYILYTDGIYERYIYYNNEWYRFSGMNDVLTDINASITYYYETKEMN